MRPVCSTRLQVLYDVPPGPGGGAGAAPAVARLSNPDPISRDGASVRGFVSKYSESLNELNVREWEMRALVFDKSRVYRGTVGNPSLSVLRTDNREPFECLGGSKEAPRRERYRAPRSR